MVNVGIVGWRGMVGSVMIDRMHVKNDFSKFSPFFFSTSQVGKIGPVIKTEKSAVENAYDLKKLAKMNVIVSCQGSLYTKDIHRKLRSNSWKGYWIDSSSELRMNNDSIIALDPINKDRIENALCNGILDYIGGNCTVSLMLMALHGIIKRNWIKWIVSTTYQAVSGAGSSKIKEMLLQMQVICNGTKKLLNNPLSTIFDINNKIVHTMESASFPIKHFNGPMATNLIPWIDAAMGNGQTREEWKGLAETNKILGLTGKKTIYVDGQCVRVNTIRCHSQALTIKLKKHIPIKDIKNAIENSNKWVQLIENDKKTTISKLNPAAVSGTLKIPIGRLRKLNIENNVLTAFTVGDQLLWGAAEPLRRMLNIIVKHVNN